MPLHDPDTSPLLNQPEKLPAWVRHTSYALVLFVLAGLVAAFLGGVYGFLNWAI